MVSKIVGDKQWEKWISSISSDVIDEVKSYVKTTAGKTETDAKFRVPVDKGDLRRSIGTDIEEQSARIKATVAPDRDYDIYVELGTSRNAPQPYLFPSFDRNTVSFEKEIHNIVRKGMK